MTKTFSQEYVDYIQSEDWKAIAEERKRIDGNKCVLCGRSDNLQVHHRSYKNLGHEDVMNDLVTLCQDCHEFVHENKDEVICGISGGVLLAKLNEADGGIAAFLDFIRITKEETQEQFEQWVTSNLAALYIPTGGTGALVIPYFRGDMHEKDLRRIAAYLGEDFEELTQFSRKLYYCALEDGGVIEDVPEKW